MVVVKQLMRFIFLLLLCGCASLPSSPSVHRVKITNDEIGFETVGISSVYVPFRDSDYLSLEVSELKSFPLFKSKRTDLEDCDESAFKAFTYAFDRFKGERLSICFGIVYLDNGATRHALNFFVDSARNYYFYEPQNGKVFPMFESLEFGVFGEVIMFLL